MSDSPDLRRPGDVNLADALRALPLAAPADSAWPAIAAQLARTPAAPRARRRMAVPAALAAVFVAAFAGLVAVRSPVPDTAPQPGAHGAATEAPGAASEVHNAANGTNATAPGSLDALQSRSGALERWLRDTGRDSAPQSAQDVAASAEIEDMIGFVDVQLADAPEDAAALPLWRRRVALLEDLATLRYGANLHQFKPGLLASDVGDARHADWPH